MEKSWEQRVLDPWVADKATSNSTSLGWVTSGQLFERKIN